MSWRGELTAETVQLGNDGQRCDCIDTPEASKPGYWLPVKLQDGNGFHLRLQGAVALLELLHRQQVGIEGCLVNWPLEAQAAQPFSMDFGPVILTLGVSVTPAGQKFAQPVTSSQQILTNIFSTPTQVPYGLLVLGGRRHFGKQTGPVQLCQFEGILAVCLDPISGPDRDE